MLWFMNDGEQSEFRKLYSGDRKAEYYRIDFDRQCVIYYDKEENEIVEYTKERWEKRNNTYTTGG